MSSYTRLIRFLPKSGTIPLIGEPVDANQDVGLASYASEAIEVEVFSGASVITPGERTGKKEMVERILSPVSRQEVGTIRCIGLNYHRHASEVKMPPTQVPSVFLKPADALADPYPAPTPIPKRYVDDNAGDYEAELAVIVGEDCKNVDESDALKYVAGFTASNDVSSRVNQFAQTQWCYSKSFDGSCPIGPAFVPISLVDEIGKMHIRGEYNGSTVQDSGIDDLIFDVPKILSFLSQGTTLRKGTVILTGTPAGVGWSAEPRRVLKPGDEFRVYVSHGVGTLINKIVLED